MTVPFPLTVEALVYRFMSRRWSACVSVCGSVIRPLLGYVSVPPTWPSEVGFPALSLRVYRDMQNLLST